MKHCGWVLLAATSIGSSAASKLKIRSGSSSDCHLWKCGQGWLAKSNHHMLTGNSNEQCCDKTCELWTCGAGYVGNAAYYSNVGGSNQFCCDKQCGKFECNENYAVSASAAGVTHEECCLPKCSLFSCDGPWRNTNTTAAVVSSKEEDCCLPTCELYNCSLADLLQDETKLNVTGASPGACCTQPCGEITCPTGWAIPEELNDTIFNTSVDTCCRKQCKSHVCGNNWAAFVNKSEEFGDSDEACCVPTCGQFNCSLEEGFVPSSHLKNMVGSDSQTCCLPTCKLWECQNNESWFTPLDNEKENQTGSTNSECCVRPCTFKSCPAGQSHVTSASTLVPRAAAECCEDSRCDFFRTNLTKMDEGAFCNGLADDTCNSMYQNRTLNASVSNVSFFVRCQYDETYGICRYAPQKNATDCRAE